AGTRVVEMPALRMNQAADDVIRFPAPLACQNQIRGHFLEFVEQVRHRASGRLLQRQDSHVMVVETQMIAVALKSGVAGVEINERVVLQAYGIGLLRREVQQSPE